MIIGRGKRGIGDRELPLQRRGEGRWRTLQKEQHQSPPKTTPHDQGKHPQPQQASTERSRRY